MANTDTAPAPSVGDDAPIDIPARTDGPSRAVLDHSADISVLTALLRARREHGGSTVAVEDGDKRTLTYTELVRAVSAFSRVIRREVPGDVVGIMLPSSVGAVIAYFAVLAAGKIPAMLNFTAGRGPLLAACRSARIGAILTADRFLSVANLQPLADALAQAAPVIALEELRKRVTARDKAFAAVAAPLGLLPRHAADSPAAIVFTSGAEGNPKGVVLTHRNFMANTAQVVAALPLERVETFFNPLPVFHSYGLGPGMILPLVLGRKLVLHPSPLRAKEVAQRIAETRANVLFATDTFLRQYARAAGDGSLSTLHFAVCGAERVRPETREFVRAKFGFQVVEGYGVTETSPVLAANHPDDIRDGTVGRLMHGIEARLVSVPGLAEGRRLLVRGPNVMAGYLDPETGAVHAPLRRLARHRRHRVLRGRVHDDPRPAEAVRQARRRDDLAGGGGESRRCRLAGRAPRRGDRPRHHARRGDRPPHRGSLARHRPAAGKAARAGSAGALPSPAGVLRGGHSAAGLRQGRLRRADANGERTRRRFGLTARVRHFIEGAFFVPRRDPDPGAPRTSW